MSVFSKIKDWLTGSSSKKSKSNTKKARAVSNYGGGGSRSVRNSYGANVKQKYRDREDEEERKRQEVKRKQNERTEALRQMSKRTDALSSGKPSATSSVTGMQTSGSGRSRALAKLAEKSNNAPTDPKQKRLKEAQDKRTENLQRLAKKVESDRQSYNKATGNKYNADTGNKEHDAKARQRIKSGEYQSDPNAEKWEVKNHPVAASAARGALSGVTFGASELVAQKSKKRKESGAEEFYQKNKNKTAETVGEIAGSLAGFGLTGGASKAAVGKLGGKAVGEKAATKLATNSRVVRAAEKELQLAIDRGAVNVTSEAMRDQLIKQFAKNRASRIVGAVGEDAAINLTTGLTSDINHAILDSDNPEEFAKNMGVNAAMNVGLGGLTAFAPALRTQQGLINRRLRDETVDAISNANMREAMRKTFAKNADDVRRIDLDELLAKKLEKEATDALSPVTVASKATVAEEAQTAAKQASDAVRAPEITPEIRPAEVAPEVRPQIVDNAIPQQPMPNVAETPAPSRMTPEFAQQAAEKDAELFDMYRGRFEQNLDDLDINSMEEILNRTRRNYEEAGIPFDATEWENQIARLRRVSSDMEDGVEWRMGNKGWERLSTKGKSKGKWIRNDPLKVKPPKKAKVEAPLPDGMTADEYARLSREADVKAQNIEDAIADKSAPRTPKPTVDERIDNIINANASEAKAEADDVSKFASIDKDVDFKGDTVDKGFAKGGDEIASAKNKIKEEVENTPTGANAFDKERSTAYAEAGVDINTDNVQHASVKDINRARGQETRDFTTHTEKGFATIATGVGDKAYQGKALEAITKGELNIEVRHNAENYGKAAKRLNEHVAKNGNTDAWSQRFEDYVNGKLKLNKDEQRDIIYDVFAAVDFANANVGNTEKRKEMERLFVSACKAGSEQVSIGGLAGNQWRKIAMSSPEYRSKAVYETILDLFNKSAGMRKAVGKAKGDKITTEELKKMLSDNPALKKAMDALEALDSAASVEQVEKCADRAILEARKVIPMTAFDQLTQWRYVAMLSSPKTHIRNLTSNIYSSTLGQLRDGIATHIEDNVLKKAVKAGKVESEDAFKSAGNISLSVRRDAGKGINEGIKLRNLTAKLEHARTELEEAGAESPNLGKMQARVKDLEAQVDKAQKALDNKVGSLGRKTATKAQEYWQKTGRDQLVTDAEKFERKNYNGKVSKGLFKVNDKLSNFISNALETSDALTLERIYREKMDKILTANGWEKMSELAEKGDTIAKARVKKLEEYAAQEAAYTAALDTYRNYTQLSSAMSKFVSNSIFNYDAPLWKKAVGLGVHAVMPFTKVPINLMKRGIDYSPIGLITAKKALTKAIEAGDVTAINRACEHLAEGAIGTGIAALGAGLGFADPESMLITGRLNKNDYIEKKKKDAGFQNYAINAGNMSFTLDWATPTSATLFTGVEFGRMLRHLCDDIANGEGMDFKFWEAFDVPLTLASTLFEPTLQLGVFQGINDTLEKVIESDNYSDTNIHPALQIVGNVFTNYATSVMTPAIMNSISRSIAPYDYLVTGETDSEYVFNQQLSKVPFLSERMLGAKTNVWGQVKNEKADTGDYAKSLAKNLVSPANINPITWDETDDWAADFYKQTGWDGAFPKNNYKKDISIGRIKGEHELKLSNKELGEYNVARGKSGSDAMADALNTVIFNRWDKDEKGHRTIPHKDNITPEERDRLVKEYEGKGIKDVLDYIRNTKQFKNATVPEQKQIISAIYGDKGDDNDESVGAKRYAEREMAVKKGMSAEEYDYYNEVPRNAQEALAPAIESGLITFKQAVDFSRDAGKTYYTTDERGEKGGTVQTRFNKREMLAYLEKAGYSDEEAAALFNAFKQSNAKEYGSSGRRGYRRRGYRRWHSWGGGGSSAKATVPKPKTFKESDFIKGEALTSKKSSSSKKATPPKLKRVERKIDLPNAKTTTKKKK